MPSFNENNAPLPMIGIDFVFKNLKMAQLPLMKVMLFDAVSHTNLSKATWNIDAYNETLVLEARHNPVLISQSIMWQVLRCASLQTRMIVGQFNQIYGTKVDCTNVELDFAPQLPAPYAAAYRKEGGDV